MPATIQIRRRLGSAGAPTVLAPGELGYNDPGGAAADALYIGTTPPGVKTLISATRQVELAGAQTITGIKTFPLTNLRILGGANNNILSTDGAGNLEWTAAPGGGILAVATDATLGGDGTSASPLSVLRWATSRNVSLQATGGTTISITPASFNGSADAIMTGFEITGLDGGTY